MQFFIAPGTLSDLTPLPYVETAGAAGYDGVGLSLQKRLNRPLHPVVGDLPLIRAIKAEIARSGMKVLDILAYFLMPDTQVDEFKVSLELGAEFGASYVITQGDDPDWARLCDSFGAFCDLAQGYGLTPIVEFMPNRALATLPLTLKLLRDTGRTDIPILVDPLHLIRSGGGANDLKSITPNLIPYVQMTDGILAPGEPDLAIAKRSGVGERRMPGEGVLPLRDIFDALPLNIPISVEIAMDRPPHISPLQRAEEALHKTKSFLGAA